MRFRIGGRDPRFKNIGGRDMRGIDRMFQLFVSLQILFGSRRGVSVVLPLLILAAVVGGGWFAFTAYNSPQRSLERAHADWDSGVSTRQISAIKQYMKLLQMSNPLETGMHWLENDRDKLYRRVVEHQVLYEKDERGAHEWILTAWDEGIRDLRSSSDEVKEFWDKSVSDKISNRRKSRRIQPAPNAAPQGAGVIDDVRLNGILLPSGN